MVVDPFGLNLWGWGRGALGLGADPPPKKRSPEDEMIERVILDNRSLNFVDRIINPGNYPVIENDPRLQPGEWATHQMGWDNHPDTGKPFVFPNIYWDEKKKQLVWPEPTDAARHALETGEYIEFDTDEEADFFSREYKRYWSK